MKKQSVAAACVTALLLLTTACGKAEEPALPLPQEEQVKTICQLAVLECEYHNLAKTTEFYNKEGDLVEERPATADEMQPTLFAVRGFNQADKTGTNN